MSFLIFAAPITFIIIFAIFVMVFASDSKRYRKNLDNSKQMELDNARAQALKAVEEMKARIQEMRAKVVEAEAELPLAMAKAFQQGNLGIMDYMNYKNLEADTGMRDSIKRMSQPETGAGK